MARTTHLLESKIKIPPVPDRMVTRSRLFHTLDSTLQPFMHLTLLSAPTGYGKTSLVSAWLRDRKHRAAWLTLDTKDNDPTRFTSYLLASLAKENTAFHPSEIAPGLHAGGELEASILIPLLNALEQHNQQTLFVLDDYHCIENPAIHDLVCYVLDNLPAQTNMMILTRADPDLPIARLRGRGQLIELRMEDLRFQPEETRSFLGSFEDIHLTPEEIQTLTRRTEGWIAGLQMAAVSLRGHSDQDRIVQNFAGDHHYIMDFLLDEVLGRQPEYVQTFLLNTSILPRLCGSLCDEMMVDVTVGVHDSQDVLRQLEQNNLFIIPLDEQREWFRYHRLFADLLQVRLRRKGSDYIQKLHQQACRWFEAQNLIEEAIEHALLGEDISRAADLLERTAQDLLMRSETTTFLRLMEHLPAEEIILHPRLSAYQAWALLFQGAPLSVVEATLPKGEEGLDPPGAEALLKAFVLLSRGKMTEGLEQAEYAFAVLPEEEFYLRDFAAFCVAATRIAAGDLARGTQLLEASLQTALGSGSPSSAVIFLTEFAEMRMKELKFNEAEELYRRGLSAATDRNGNRLPIAGRSLIGLGNLALERFDLEEAENLLKDGIQLIKHWSLISTLEAHIFLASVHFARGAVEEMSETFALLHDLARRFDASEIDDRVVEMVEADFKGRLGDLNAVRDWLVVQDLDKAPQTLPSHHKEDHLSSRLYKYQLPIIIRLLIAETRFVDAEIAVKQLYSQAQEANRPVLVLEATILECLLLDAQGHSDSALLSLQRALELAYPAGILRPFLTQGDRLIHLLQQGRESWDAAELQHFTDHLLRKIGASKAADRGGPEGLSPRELEVLRLLPGELTADQMASELIVSVNTIRTHMKNIYAKLGVHSRHQAVEQARKSDFL